MGLFLPRNPFFRSQLLQLNDSTEVAMNRVNATCRPNQWRETPKDQAD